MASVKPRLLVIGSRGFLGSHAASAGRSEFEVIEANHSANGGSGLAIDVRDQTSIKTAFEVAKPESVLLFSAISDIDRCQQFPEEAEAVNFRGAQYVAEACADGGARLLFTSTAAVFDGQKHGYSEDDPVSPVSVYGETKAKAEKAVLALGSSAIVVRIALAIGFAANKGTNSILDTLKAKWSSGQVVRLPVHEQRNPIDASTASRFMLELLDRNGSGIFHIGCADPITRYDLGLKLAGRMRYPAKQVQPQLGPNPGRAPRGPDHYLLTDKLRALSSIPIPTCEQVIERCFNVAA